MSWLYFSIALLAVRSGHPVRPAAIFPSSVERAEIAVSGHSPLIAQDAESRVPIVTRLVAGLARRGFVQGENGGHGVLFPDLTRQLEPDPRVDDRPSVDDGQQGVRLGRAGQLEHLASFQEKRPLLGEEQIVAEVDVDLAGVGLDLAEVRVPSPVEDELGGYAVLPGEVVIVDPLFADEGALLLRFFFPVRVGRQDLEQGVLLDVKELEGHHLGQEKIAAGRVEAVRRMLIVSLSG